LKRERRHRSGARMNACRDVLQHLLGDIESPHLRFRIALFEDAGEATLPAADIERALSGEIAQMIEQQLDVIDPRVDSAREVLLISRRLVERLPDTLFQLRRQPWAWT